MCFKCIVYFNSFDPHHNLAILNTMSVSIVQMGKLREKESKRGRVVDGRTEIQTQAIWLQGPCSLTMHHT